MSFSSAAKIGAKVVGLGLYACACYFGANAVAASQKGEKSQIETIWENVKHEYDTYQEIKKEGIEAPSYKEAKQKLDSIKDVRLYEKYGLIPPSESDSPAEALNKALNLQIKLQEDNIKQLEGVIDILQVIGEDSGTNAAKTLQMPNYAGESL